MTARGDTAGLSGSRLVWLDALRGITMFLVVFGHVGRGLHEAGAITAPLYLRLDHTLYSLHGPLLFVLGGFTFRGQIARRPFLASWATRLVPVLHPYFVWTTITAGIMLLLAAVVNNPLGPADFLGIVLLSPLKPYSVFWFLYVLAMVQVTTACLVESGRFSDRQLLVALLAGFAMNQLLLAGFGPIDWLQLTNFPRYLGFFLLGYLLAGHTERLTGRVAVLTGMTAIGCWSLIIGFDLGIDHGFGLFTGTVGCIFCFAVLRRLEPHLPGLFYAFWAFVGLWSLEIYVMHLLFNGATRVGLMAFGIASLPVHLVVGSFVGTAGPILAGVVLRRLGLAGLLGLRTGTPGVSRPRDARPGALESG